MELPGSYDNIYEQFLPPQPEESADAAELYRQYAATVGVPADAADVYGRFAEPTDDAAGIYGQFAAPGAAEQPEAAADSCGEFITPSAADKQPDAAGDFYSSLSRRLATSRLKSCS